MRRLLSNTLEELDHEINGLESVHASADFSDIDELILRLKDYLNEMYGLIEVEIFTSAFRLGGRLMLATLLGEEG